MKAPKANYTLQEQKWREWVTTSINTLLRNSNIPSQIVRAPDAGYTNEEQNFREALSRLIGGVNDRKR